MAHECPECNQVCYCNGDIDDCLLNLPHDQNCCIHFTQPECSGFESEESNEDSISKPDLIFKKRNSNQEES